MDEIDLLIGAAGQICARSTDEEVSGLAGLLARLAEIFKERNRDTSIRRLVVD